MHRTQDGGGTTESKSLKILYPPFRGGRGHRNKKRKNSVKFGKNYKNRLGKKKNKPEILEKEHFRKLSISAEKRNSHTPGLYNTLFFQFETSR